jgi:hypothetical protein
VPDTKLSPELLRLARVACAAIGSLYADAGHDSRDDRWRCLREGIRPMTRKGGSGHGSGLGVVRSVVERVIEKLLRYRRLDRRQDRSSTIVRSPRAAVCIFILAEEIGDS